MKGMSEVDAFFEWRLLQFQKEGFEKLPKHWQMIPEVYGNYIFIQFSWCTRLINFEFVKPSLKFKIKF